MKGRNGKKTRHRFLVLAYYWSLDSEKARSMGEAPWAGNILGGSCKLLDIIGLSFVQRSARAMASWISRLHTLLRKSTIRAVAGHLVLHVARR